MRTDDAVELTAVDPFTSSGDATTVHAVFVFELLQEGDTLTGALDVPIGGYYTTTTTTSTGPTALTLDCAFDRAEE